MSLSLNGLGTQDADREPRLELIGEAWRFSLKFLNQLNRLKRAARDRTVQPAELRNFT